MINDVITLSKWLWNHELQASGSAADTKNYVNLFFTIIRSETGQIPEINKVFERQV